MAITFGTPILVATATTSQSVTVPAGTAALLVLMGAGNTQTTPPTMTYAGVSMTRIGGTASNSAAGGGYAYYLAGPATGANTLAIGAVLGGSQNSLTIIPINGCSNSSPVLQCVDAYQTTAGAYSSSLTTSNTTSAIVFALLMKQKTSLPTATSGTTGMTISSLNSTGGSFSSAIAYGATTLGSPTSKSVSWGSAANGGDFLAIEIPPGISNSSITPSGLASTLAFGTLRTKNYALPSGIASTLAFGTLKTSQTVPMMAMPSTLLFGTLRTKNRIVPSAIAPTSALGTPKTTNIIKPSGLASTLAFGTLKTKNNVRMTGIAPTSALGALVVTQPGPSLSFIFPSSIVLTNAFGTLKTKNTIKMTGLPSSLAFGNTRTVGYVKPTGIAPTSTLGSPRVKTGIRPLAIDPTNSFGAILIVSRAYIFPLSIDPTVEFGLFTIKRTLPPGTGVWKDYTVTPHSTWSLPADG